MRSTLKILSSFRFRCHSRLALLSPQCSFLPFFTVSVSVLHSHLPCRPTMQASDVPGCGGQAAPNWRTTGESLSFYVLLLGLRCWHSSHSSLPGLSPFLFIRSRHQPSSLSSEARTCRAANSMWWVFLTNTWSQGYKALRSRPAFLTSPAAGAPIPLPLVSGRVPQDKRSALEGLGRQPGPRKVGLSALPSSRPSEGLHRPPTLGRGLLHSAHLSKRSSSRNTPRPPG